MGKADKYLTNFKIIFVFFHIQKILIEQPKELYHDNLNTPCRLSSLEERFRGVIDLKAELQGKTLIY